MKPFVIRKDSQDEPISTGCVHEIYADTARPAQRFDGAVAQGRRSPQPAYRFEVELVSDRPDLDLESLLHQPAFLAFNAQGAGIHGQVHSVAQGESGKHLTRYHVTLVPRRAYLAHARQQTTKPKYGK
ncbi:hypothetical protein PS903_03850 [Pseudomonas fluorescens]|nr:hypothetical protein PS903_03850 [Pseudomonas fluorescens]